MKLIGKRAGILMLLCLLFFAGMVLFLITYFKDAPKWVAAPMNQHIFANGKLANAGRILDADGRGLVYSEGGERKYNGDSETRVATMHLVGDRNGNVSTSLQVTYLSKLSGWNFLTGVYSIGNDYGNNIKTTVDADVARVAYSALNGRKGTVGVMNYETGDLVCMVSSTSFDPSNPPDVAADPAKYDGVYINRLMSATYTPGSIFKLVTASAALNEIPGIYERTFACSGAVTIGNGQITCMHAHGNQNFSDTLVNSCNVAYAEMAREIGPVKMMQYAKNAGLNTELKMNGISVSTGVFDLNNADELALSWAGVGQSKTLINPLSYLQFVASIANDGKLVSPNIIDSIKTPEGIPAHISFDLPGGSSMDANTARALQRMMRACVTENYGEGGLQGYNMSAKTGTAETSEDSSPHSWYCGFLNNDNAPLAFIVLVENGGSGSSAAYDVAKKVLAEAVK